MIWVLIFGVLLVALGSFAAGVASGPWLRRALPPLQEHRGHHVPAREIERAFAGSRPSGVEPLPASGGTPEDAPARPGQGTSGVINTPLLAVREHADAMWQASEPYLPPSPAGEHPYAYEHERAAVTAWGPNLDVYASFAALCAAREVKLTTGEWKALRPPWETAPIPAYVEQTMIPVRRVPTEPMALPAATDREMRDEYFAPVYGEVPVAGMLEAERQDAGLMT